MFFPVTIPHSQCPFHNHGKRGDECSNCSTSCIFWGGPATGDSVLNVESCLLLFFGKSVLHMCRHKNIYNLVVESYVLFSKDLLGFQNQEAASKIKEFSTFLCGGRFTSHLTVIIPFDTHLTTWDQYPVFSFLSFLRDHSGEWLRPDGC